MIEPASTSNERGVEPIDDVLESPLLRPRRAVQDDELDITPMIDITFLLLIYFLLVSTPDVQTAIELPAARHGDAVSQRNASVITVGETGGDRAPVFLADGKVTAAQVMGTPPSQQLAIADHVRQGLQEEGKVDVLIKADRRVPHREVAWVIRAVSQVDGIRLHLGVLQAEE